MSIKEHSLAVSFKHSTIKGQPVALTKVIVKCEEHPSYKNSRPFLPSKNIHQGTRIQNLKYQRLQTSGTNKAWLLTFKAKEV